MASNYDYELMGSGSGRLTWTDEERTRILVVKDADPVIAEQKLYNLLNELRGEIPEREPDRNPHAPKYLCFSVDWKPEGKIGDIANTAIYDRYIVTAKYKPDYDMEQRLAAFASGQVYKKFEAAVLNETVPVANKVECKWDSTGMIVQGVTPTYINKKIRMTMTVDFLPYEPIAEAADAVGKQCLMYVQKADGSIGEGWAVCVGASTGTNVSSPFIRKAWLKAEYAVRFDEGVPYSELNFNRYFDVTRNPPALDNIKIRNAASFVTFQPFDDLGGDFPTLRY